MPPILPSALRSPDRIGASAGPPPPDPTWWEGIKAGFETGRDDMDAQVQAPRQYDAYHDALDALGKLGVDTSTTGPLFDDGPTATMAMTPGGPVYSGPAGRVRVLNPDKLFSAMQQRRFAGLPATREEWDRQIATRFGARARDAATAARAPVASLIGGAGAMATDPAQVMTMFVGGGGGTVGRFVLGEALAGASGAVVALPDRAAARARMGESYGAADMVADVAMGAAGNVVLGAAGKYVAAPAIKAVAAPVLEASLARIIPHLPEALRPKIRGLEDIPDADLANAFEAMVGRDKLTEAERGAIAALRRAGDEAASNPFVPDGAGIKAHQSKLQAALDRIVQGTPAPSARARFAGSSALVGGQVRAPGEPGAPTGRAAEAFVVNRIAGNPSVEGTGKNPASSAVGVGQFVDDTFVQVFKATFPDRARLSRAQILKQRGTGVERAMLERFTADNAAALAKAGQPVTPANLYLAHFLGEGDAVKVLRHGADTPLEGLISKASIDANASILKGRTVRDAIAFAERKMGGRESGGGGVAAGGAAGDGADALAIDAMRAGDAVDAAEAGLQAGQEARAAAMRDSTEALSGPITREEGPVQGDLFGPAPEPQLLPKYRETVAEEPAPIMPMSERDQLRALSDQIGQARTIAPVRTARSYTDARQVVKEFQGQELINAVGGLRAVVSRNTIDKMLNAKAVGKSTSLADHLNAVANIDHLFAAGHEFAVHADARGEPTIRAMRRFVTIMNGENGPVAVKMTVKETANASRTNPLYTVETIALKKVGPGGDSLPAGAGEALRTPGQDRNAPQAGTDGDIAPTGTADNGMGAPDPIDAPPMDAPAQRQLSLFDDPVADAAQRQADSALHDLVMLAEAAPDVMITPEADAAPVPLAEYLRSLDEEEAGLDKIDACLAPAPTMPKMTGE